MLREEIELESAARRYERFYIRLLDEHGEAILTTPGMAEQLDLAEVAGRTRGRSERSISRVGRRGQAFRACDAAASVGNPPTSSDTIQIAIDVSQEEEVLRRYRFWFWGILLVISVLFPVLGYRIARHGIRPVEEIAATARRITSNNLRERITAEGYASELASLAGTFNEMLDRLEESFEQVSRFSADIAHDLRTPVNNIRGEAEVALARARTVDEYREVLESSLEETVRLSELIGDLLFLARAESPLTQDSGVFLVLVPAGGPITAELDRSLMLRAVSNLVSNAIIHTPGEGSVNVAASATDGEIRIKISDTGIGIPAEAVPRVFDRFFRVDPSRSRNSGGTGLGLTIVQSIMTLHGGSAEIGSEVGRGTCVTLRMPTPAAR